MPLMRRHGTQAEWEKLRLIAANMFEQGLANDVIAASLKGGYLIKPFGDGSGYGTLAGGKR